MAQRVTSLSEDQSAAQNPDNAAGPQKTKTKRSRLRIWLYILLGSIVAIASIIAFIIFRSSSRPAATNDCEAGATDSKDQQSILSSAPIFSSVYPFQVNLADGRRYVAIDMRFEVADTDTIIYMSRRLPIINDLIIGTLQRETVEELRTGAGVNQLKQDILRRVNSGRVFSEDFIKLKKTATPIKDVFFDKFILQ